MLAIQSPAELRLTAKPEMLQGVEIDIGSNADCFNSRTSAQAAAISSHETRLQVPEESLPRAFSSRFCSWPDS